jgi:hypothetical protein
MQIPTNTSKRRQNADTGNATGGAVMNNKEVKCAAANQKAQFATADSADFEKNTWTFLMDGNYYVQGGRFAIIRESEYQRLIANQKPDISK